MPTVNPATVRLPKSLEREVMMQPKSSEHRTATFLQLLPSLLSGKPRYWTCFLHFASQTVVMLGSAQHESYVNQGFPSQELLLAEKFHLKIRASARVQPQTLERRNACWRRDGGCWLQSSCSKALRRPGEVESRSCLSKKRQRSAEIGIGEKKRGYCQETGEEGSCQTNGSRKAVQGTRLAKQRTPVC